jgi:hypothetical protein
MALQSSKTTMDVIPWPNGQGFQGRTLWWEYVLNLNEQARIDFLMMAALLSTEVCAMLLNHNQDLLEAFNFSEEMLSRLSEIQVSTLEEFADAMLPETAPSGNL